jgi:negative elongation factor A
LQPPPTKHFTLKRKPKSAALRAELLQKSADAASNLKKSTAPTVPVRSRGMPRKMTDTSMWNLTQICIFVCHA